MNEGNFKSDTWKFSQNLLEPFFWREQFQELIIIVDMETKK